MTVKLTLTPGQANVMLEVMHAHRDSGEYWGNRLAHYMACSSIVEALGKALNEKEEESQ